MTNVLVYGSSGTGKTILCAEIVKIKLSQFLDDKKPVKIIVSMYANPDESALLLQNMKEKYFKNIGSQVLSLSMLACDLNI